MVESFLSERQMEVLRLRGKGITQGEVARFLGTTRENISITEGRALKNVERARRTLEEFEMLDPVVIEVEEGTDLFSIPGTVLRAGDRHGIKVLYDKTSLVGSIRRHAGPKIAGNKVVQPFAIYLLRGGRVRLSMRNE